MRVVRIDAGRKKCQSKVRGVPAIERAGVSDRPGTNNKTERGAGQTRGGADSQLIEWRPEAFAY